MIYFKNQNVTIESYDGNKKSFKVISNQKKSTPGISFNLFINAGELFHIHIEGYKVSKGYVYLWIKEKNDSSNYKLHDEHSEIDYFLFNNEEKSMMYKICILFKYPKINDYFVISKISFTKMDSRINPNNFIQTSNNRSLKTLDVKSPYLYVYYHKEPVTIHVLWQYFIKKAVKYCFDIINVLDLTSEIINRYDVIILDCSFILKQNKYIDQYTKILGDSNTKKAIYLHDTHEYTWMDGYTTYGDILKTKDINAPSISPENGAKRFLSLLKAYNIKYLISRYECKEFDNILGLCRSYIDDYFYLSHHINKDYFHDYNFKKEFDILLYGCTDPQTYPFRYRLKNLLENNRDRFNINLTPTIKRVYNNSLGKLINQSWISIVTKSNFDYLVCKYFEIAGSKSVVAGDMPQQGKKIFGNNYIKLNNDMTDDEIINELEKWLNNKKILEKTANKMYKKIHDYYTYDQFCIKLFYICEKINDKIDVDIGLFKNIDDLVNDGIKKKSNVYDYFKKPIDTKNYF